jgi:hypothetical protein
MTKKKTNPQPKQKSKLLSDPELQPDWQMIYLERLNICPGAFKRSLDYSSPLDAWNNWDRAEEMVWLLKRAGVDNRALSQCLLEIFNRYYPYWQRRTAGHPHYKVQELFEGIEDYIAKKKSLSALKKQWRALRRDSKGYLEYRSPSLQGKGGWTDYYCFLAILKAGELITARWTDTDSFYFFLPAPCCLTCECPYAAEARDSIRKYFPDPDVFMEEALYGK